MRSATIKRKTTETDIELTLGIDGQGNTKINTGIPFFDHMLTLWTVHGGFNLSLKAEGDTNVDFHHTVEDVGICLGQALKEALADKKGINRYGFFILPMDEALCQTAVDISSRPYLHYGVTYPQPATGDFEAQLIHEFFKALSNNSGLTLHINVNYGDNVHHIIESIFKSFGRSLKQAVAVQPGSTAIPSTKGLL